MKGRQGLNRRTWFAVAPLALSVLFGSLAQAEPQKKLGNIQSIDWQRMEMDIKEKPTGVGTWKIARDCSVRFLDQKEKFRNPSLNDLKPPMYIAFYFERDSDVINSIEVVDVGFNVAAGGAGAQVDAVVTNLDMNIGHVEVRLNPGGVKTFEVDPKSALGGIRIGDRVKLLIDTREGGREVVTRITK